MAGELVIEIGRAKRVRLLALMLGVRRSSVTLAFGSLSRAGLIDHASKKIRIRNRQGLEAASCECYRTVAKCFDRLLS